MTEQTDHTKLLSLRDDSFKADLQRIGAAIGYGRAQQILGELWDGMLANEYGATPGRGRIGVTVDDALPPVPKATNRRRVARLHGGYEMVPAYTVEEMKAFAHAAIDNAAAIGEQK